MERAFGKSEKKEEEKEQSKWEKERPLSVRIDVSFQLLLPANKEKNNAKNQWKGASAAASATKNEHVCSLWTICLRFMCGMKMARKDAAIRQPRRQFYLSHWPN